MPRYKKNYRRNNRRRYNNSTAQKALRLAKKAYKLPELKYKDSSFSTTNPDSSGSLNILMSLNQGTTNNERVGDTVSPTSMTIRGKMNIHSSATATQVRILIFRWLSEAPGAVTDVLESAAITSFKSQNLRYQSEILYDRVFQLDSVNRPELYWQKKIKLKHKICYPESSSAANRNGIYAIVLSDEATNTPTLDTKYRIFYRDA